MADPSGSGASYLAFNGAADSTCTEAATNLNKLVTVFSQPTRLASAHVDCSLGMLIDDSTCASTVAALNNAHVSFVEA